MKKTLKLIGIIALAAVIGLTMTTCDDGGGDIPITFISLSANGSSSQTTTQLTLTFSQAISGLNANDITLSGVSGISKGTLSGSGPIYTLPVGGFAIGGTLSVSVSKSGYEISGSPKSTAIYYYSGGGSSAITYTITQTGGVDGVTDTAGIIFTFSASVDSLNLTAGDITISGTASKGYSELSGTGATRTLAITVDSAGKATVTIAKTGIEAETKHITVYKAGKSAPILTGITAVYSGTAAIYPTTPLNNLKADLTVKVQYSNGDEYTLSENEYTLDGMLTVGTNIITVSYTDGVTKTTTFTVTAASSNKTLTGITLNTDSVKRDYNQNETLDLSGLAVTANYNDSTSVAVTNYTTNPADGATLSTTGAITVTVSYTEGTITETASFIVNVTNVTGTTGLAYEPINNGTAYRVSAGTVTGGAVVIPATHNGLPVTEIGNQAFRNRSLTSVTIGSNVTSIGNEAFEYNQLTSVIIPNSVTSIGYEAFGYNQLISITIGANVQFSAFGEFFNDAYNNTYNKSAGTYTRPNTNSTDWTRVDGTDNGTAGLSFTLIDNGTAYSVSKGTVTSGAVIIPATYNGLPVTEIGNSAFSECISITAVHIPETVTSIGTDAFYRCTLTSITLPASLTFIGNSAFSECLNIASITIPASVTSVYNAFPWWTDQQTIYVAGHISQSSADAAWGTEWRVVSWASCNAIIIYGTDNGTAGLNFTLINNNTAYSVSKGTVTGGAVVIPATYNGLPVTEIGYNAFAYCTSLTSITIPASVTSILDGELSTQYGAFYGCTSLTSITFAEGSQLQSIGDYAFRNCTGLTGITIPAGVTSIGSNAFTGCTSLTSITIPASVTSIEYSTFYNCTGLTTVTFAEGSQLQSIVPYAFAYCYSITSITIPASVTSIGNDAFKGCTGLTGITIPASVTEIGYNAFRDCTGLAGITIPAGVTSIGNNAFNGCTSLTGITIPASVTEIGAYAFNGCTSLTAVTFEGTIASGSFSTDYAFPGDLRDKFYATDSANGTPGTYTRPNTTSTTWTRLNGVANITAPTWRDGSTISLAVPPVALPSGNTVTAQGWQISDNGSSGWAYFTASTAEMSYNGKYLRYYAASSGGQTYYSNTVTILVISATAWGEVTIAMYDYDGDGWNGSGALRIVKNGTQLATGVKVQTTASNNTPSGQRSSNTYTFSVASGDVIQFYWVAGSYQNENSFIAYYTDLPPSPAFTSGNNNNWSGSNALVYKLSGTMNNIAGGAFLGSFTVP